MAIFILFIYIFIRVGYNIISKLPIALYRQLHKEWWGGCGFIFLLITFCLVCFKFIFYISM